MSDDDDEPIEGVSVDEAVAADLEKRIVRPANGRAKMLYQVILAVVAAGGAGSWLKPGDDTAALKAYDTTRTAIVNLDEDIGAIDGDLDELHDWRHGLDRKLRKLQREVDWCNDAHRADIPPERYHPAPGVEADLEDQPERHPRPSKRPDRPTQARPPLPAAHELL